MMNWLSRLFGRQPDAYEHDPRLEYSTQPDLYQARADFYANDRPAYEDFVCDQPVIVRGTSVYVRDFTPYKYGDDRSAIPLRMTEAEIDRQMRIGIATQALHDTH